MWVLSICHKSLEVTEERRSQALAVCTTMHVQVSILQYNAEHMKRKTYGEHLRFFVSRLFLNFRFTSTSTSFGGSKSKSRAILTMYCRAGNSNDRTRRPGSARVLRSATEIVASQQIIPRLCADNLRARKKVRAEGEYDDLPYTLCNSRDHIKSNKRHKIR